MEAGRHEKSLSDLRKILSAGQHLLKLINEVLDLSKIDAGMMELYVEDISIPGLVRESVNSFQMAAQSAGNVISVDVKLRNEMARIDHLKLNQVLAHLLDNATKFTSNGLISVAVSMDCSDPESPTLDIAVKDTGIGIDAKEMPTLFEHFTVLGDASSSKYGGTGLGLALSRKLCRVMGGDLLAESKLGVGSCFRVRLPIIAGSYREAKVAAPITPHPLRVALGIGQRAAA
jgi:signal transduction histidine kinase